MATSPESGGLFLSSTPTRYSSGPLEEVQLLLKQARSVGRIDPAIRSIISIKNGPFFDTFARHINLINSRSQTFQDCHITVFDKVLLELTDCGRDLDNPAAIQYFCDEFLAVPKGANTARRTSALTDTLSVLHAVSCKHTPSSSVSSS